MTTEPATPAECIANLVTNGHREPHAVESHHMVKLDGKWTCIHCGVER